MMLYDNWQIIWRPSCIYANLATYEGNFLFPLNKYHEDFSKESLCQKNTTTITI